MHTNKVESTEFLLQVKAAIFGVAVGDALGVPVEFEEREDIHVNPVTDMVGYGTYDLPAGTWSDDTSLTLCLAEALTQGFDLQTIAKNFILWMNEGWWTPYGVVFDIGNSTEDAISKLVEGVHPLHSGGMEEIDNGNGSLMRIIPLVFLVRHYTIQDRFDLVSQVSSITHGHIRSIIACFYYVEFALQLLDGKDKRSIYSGLKKEISDFLHSRAIDSSEFDVFQRLLVSDIDLLDESEIQSSGYVVHTLEAAIWCILTTESFEEAVLKAVNLGDDSDTTGAVTGGLAGLLYGYHSIPTSWISQLARCQDMDGLTQRLAHKLYE